MGLSPSYNGDFCNSMFILRVRIQKLSYLIIFFGKKTFAKKVEIAEEKYIFCISKICHKGVIR